MRFELQVFRATAVVLGVVIMALALWQLSVVLLLIFAAILVGIFLHGLASALAERTPLSPGAALGIIIGGIVLLAGGCGYFLLPGLTAQASEMEDALPASWSKVEGYVRALPFGEQMMEQADQQEMLRSDTVQSNIKRVFTVTVSGLVQFAFAMVAGIYLAARPHSYVEGILKLLPNRHRGRACEFLAATRYTLQWWLIGQVIIMVFVGSATAIGLALLGIALALLLGVIAGLLDFVPNVGPLVAAIPALLIAFLQGPEAALFVALLYLGIQQLEGNVLTPLVHKRTVSLEPALILAAQLAFGVTVGVLGVLLATPLVAVALVAVKMLYLREVLGRKVEIDGMERAGQVCAVDGA